MSRRCRLRPGRGCTQRMHMLTCPCLVMARAGVLYMSRLAILAFRCVAGCDEQQCSLRCWPVLLTPSLG